MTMYAHEEFELLNDIRADALQLALSFTKYEFCGTYFGLKMAAGYLHHRYSVPTERLEEIIPTTLDVVPHEYHRQINAVYVDDSSKIIHVVINFFRDDFGKMEAYAKNVTETFMEMMRTDYYYDYSKQIVKAQKALDEGYKVSFEMFGFDKQDNPFIILGVNESIEDKGWEFDIISIEDMERILGIEIKYTMESCTIKWRQ